MKVFKTILTAILLFMGMAATDSVAGQSVRERFAGMDEVTAVYSIDESFTVIKSYLKKDELLQRLDNACPGFSCGSYSFVGTLEFSGDYEGGEAMLIRHNDPQPAIYKNPRLPALDDISVPETGRLEGDHRSIDVFQYMSALCGKVNGNPSFVVPKKYGKFTRLTQVEPLEAFNYLATSGEGKQGWLLACEGDEKFVVQKNFKYNPGEENKFYFHHRRGLEGFDYVKAAEEEDKLMRPRPSRVQLFDEGPVF